MANENSNTNGKNYSIHENVVISIVRNAIKDIPGLARLAGGNFLDSLGELVGGSGNKFDRSVIVNALADGSISIEIRVVCEYGSKIADTAIAVQEAVYKEVTDYTGMKISEIKILVSDIEEPEKDDASSGEDGEDEPELVDAVVEQGPSDATI